MAAAPSTAQVLLVLRRAIAVAVDIALFFAFMAALGMATYAATDGAVRQRAAITSTRACTPLAAAPVTPPAWFEADGVRLCHKTSFGVTTDRAFLFTQTDAATGETMTWSAPADASGRPAFAFYLDWNFIGWMLLAFAAFEAFTGATPAKHLLGVRVRDATTGARLSFRRAFARNALVFGPLAAAEAVTLIAERSGVLDVRAPLVTWAWYAAAAWLVFAMIQVVLARPDSLLDRWAGARVTAR
ncbi:MAG: RDD family protein [Hyphomonadaceae bacterium]|nr:RDD family protein [Hyphomonadaceae bacterium]